MADDKFKFGLETEADTKPVEEYSEAYLALQEQLAAAQAELDELSQKSEKTARETENLEKAKKKVDELKGALEKEAKALTKVEKATGKTEQATEDATDATKKDTEARKKGTEAMRLATATMEELHEWQEKNAKLEEEAARRARKEDANEDVRKIRRAQQGEALGKIAARLGEVSGKLKTAGAEIGEFDKELGGTIAKMGELGEVSSSVIDGAAAGFAVGGPVGAALGGLGSAIGKVYTTWVEAEQDVARAQKKNEENLKRIHENMREVGREIGREEFLNFQKKLAGNIEALKRQNVELQRSIDLEREKAALVLEQEELERRNALADIQRKAARGRLDPDQAAKQVFGIRNKELEAAERARLAPFQAASQDAASDVAGTQAQLDELRKQLENLPFLVAERQESLNQAQSTLETLEAKGKGDSKRAMKISAHIGSMDAQIRRGPIEENRLQEKIESLESTLAEKQAEQKAIDQSLANQLEAAEKRLQTNQRELLAEAKDAFEAKASQELKPLVDEVVNSAGDLSKLSETTRSALETLVARTSDNIPDYEQFGEIYNQWAIAAQGGLQKAQETLTIASQITAGQAAMASTLEDVKRRLGTVELKLKSTR